MGASKFLSIFGKTFGNWKVIDLHELRGGLATTFTCVCVSCGQERVFSKEILNTRPSHTCRKKTKPPKPSRKKVNPSKLPRPPRTIYSHYVSRAKKKSIVWSLSESEVLALTKQDCHYCGNSPSHHSHLENGPYNTIDRVSSELGYESTNVVASCAVCNRMKMSMSYEDFLAHVRRISDRHLR